MKRLFSTILTGCGVLLALAAAANAQGWQRDRYYGDDPYYDNRYPDYRNQQGRYGSGDSYGYGYDRSAQFLVNRVMSDLDQAARRAHLDGHEADHFNEVARNLQEFQARWARGKFDTGKLDKAIHNLEHLAEADRVRGRDRDMLTRDLYDLRDFRARRGRY